MSDAWARRQARTTAFGLLALFVFAASAAGQSDDEKENVGKRTYAAVCGGCHGLDGKGGERAPDIANRPRVRELSDEGLLRILQNGVPNTSMPSFRSLGEEKLRALLAHVRGLQGLRSAEAIPGNAGHGRELFFEKGGCANCHMVSGSGGFFASDLSSYAQGRSPEIVRQAIVFPNRELEPRRRVVIATLASGEILEGAARNEDNFSLQLLTRDGTLHLLYKSSLTKLVYRDESAMPADYGAKLSTEELDDLVKFLASVAESQSDRKKREDREEE